jgi:hypothetical protein
MSAAEFLAAHAARRTALYVPVVERCVREWHGGIVPSDRILFIARLLDEVMPQSDLYIGGAFDVAGWLRERALVAEYLAAAVDCVARQQEARWQN